jgi:hypothetical protein
MKLLALMMSISLFSVVAYADECAPFEKVVVAWYSTGHISNANLQKAKQAAIKELTDRCESWNGVIRDKSIIPASTTQGYAEMAAICQLGN